MDILGIISSIIGIASLFAVIHQSVNLQKTISSQIYQNFVNNSIEIDRTLIEYPHLRKYVYGELPLTENTPDLDRIMSIIELIMDINENTEVYHQYIPKARRIGWEKFIHDTQATPAYNFYMQRYGKWYE